MMRNCLPRWTPCLLAALCCLTPAQDQEVIFDDLIVIGRGCVGTDCVSTGESGLAPPSTPSTSTPPATWRSPAC